MKVILSIALVSLLNFNMLFSQNMILKEGDDAPTFYLRSVDNTDFFLRDWCGRKLRKPWIHKTKYTIILSFFATWCIPCLKEIPHLEHIANKYKNERVRIFLIDVKEDKETVKKFLIKNKIHLPVLLDRYGMVSKKYGVSSLPRLIIIDKSGKIALVKHGYSENVKEIISKKLDSLLKN